MTKVYYGSASVRGHLMRQRDVLSRYGTRLLRKTTLLQEGYQQPAIEIFDGQGGVLLTAELLNDRVFRIRTGLEQTNPAAKRFADAYLNDVPRDSGYLRP